MRVKTSSSAARAASVAWPCPQASRFEPPANLAMWVERMILARRHHAGVAEEVAAPGFDSPATESTAPEGVHVAIELGVARNAAERPAKIARDLWIRIQGGKRVPIPLAPRPQPKARRFDDQANKRLLTAIAVLALVTDVLDRDDILALCGVEHDDALRRASGDADTVHRAADQLAGIGDQHDLVAVLDRE